MSLRPEPIGEIPAETARVARAAFPRGTVVTRLRDEFHSLYQDEDFRDFYPRKGQSALAPWQGCSTLCGDGGESSPPQVGGERRQRADGRIPKLTYL